MENPEHQQSLEESEHIQHDNKILSNLILEDMQPLYYFNVKKTKEEIAEEEKK